MKEIYKDYLFEKHILVSDEETEEKHVFEPCLQWHISLA